MRSHDARIIWPPIDQPDRPVPIHLGQAGYVYLAVVVARMERDNERRAGFASRHKIHAETIILRKALGALINVSEQSINPPVFACRRDQLAIELQLHINADQKVLDFRNTGIGRPFYDRPDTVSLV